MVKYFIRTDNCSLNDIKFNNLLKMCQFISETVLNEYKDNYYKPGIHRNEVVFEKVELYNLKEFVAMIESRIRMFISTHAPVYGKSVVFGLNVFMLNDGKISCNINSEVTNTLWCEKFNISIVDFMEKREDAKNGQA